MANIHNRENDSTYHSMNMIIYCRVEQEMLKQCLLVSLTTFCKYSEQNYIPIWLVYIAELNQLLLSTVLGYSAGCIEFNCDTGQSQNVEYQCRVEKGYILIWQIVAENSTCTKKYNQLSTVSALEQISDCPKFRTVLLSNTPPFMSNISFNVESNITGLTIICEDVSGTTKECKLLGISIIFM